jgi:hypothetical protein
MKRNPLTLLLGGANDRSGPTEHRRVDRRTLDDRETFTSMIRHIVTALFALSVSYICLVALAIVVNAFFIPTFEEVGHLENGCYLTDALWFYVKCSGFFGAEVLSQVLTIPWLLMLSPALLLHDPIYAIALWSPLAYFVYYCLRLRGAAA